MINTNDAAEVQLVNTVFANWKRAAGSGRGAQKLLTAKEVYANLMEKASLTENGSTLKCAIGKRYLFSFPYASVNEWEDNRTAQSDIFAPDGKYTFVLAPAKGDTPNGYDSTHIDKWDPRIKQSLSGHIFDMPATDAINFLIKNSIEAECCPRDKSWFDLYQNRLAALNVDCHGWFSKQVRLGKMSCYFA